MSIITGIRYHQAEQGVKWLIPPPSSEPATRASVAPMAHMLEVDPGLCPRSVVRPVGGELVLFQEAPRLRRFIRLRAFEMGLPFR